MNQGRLPRPLWIALATVVLVVVALMTAGPPEIPERVTLPPGAIAQLGGRISNPIVDFNLSPDGEVIAEIGADGTLALWKCKGGELLPQPGISGRVSRPTFSPEGRLIAVVAGGKPREWEVKTSKERRLATVAGTQTIEALQYSSSGALLAAVRDKSDADDLHVLNLHSHREVGIVRGVGSIQQVVFSLESRRAIVSHLKSVALWDLESGLKVTTRPIRSPEAPIVGFLPGATPVAVFSPEDPASIHVMDVTNGKAIQKFAHQEGKVRCLGVTAGSDLIALKTSESNVLPWEKSTLLVQRLTTGAEVCRFGVDRNAREASLSTDGAIVAVRSYPRGNDFPGTQSLGVWDIAEERRLDVGAIGHRGAVTAVAFGADASVLASAADDGTVRTWDIPTAKASALLDDGMANGRSLAVSPDGQLVAASAGGFYAGGSHVVVWNAATGARLASMPVAYISDSAAVCFSRDGKFLTTGARLPRGGWSIGGDDARRTHGGLEVWDRDDIQRFPFPAEFRQWIVGPRKSKFRNRRKLSAFDGEVNGVALSNDGSLLASVGSDSYGRGMLALWSLPSGDLISNFSRQPWFVGQVAFAPDEKLLATTSSFNIHEHRSFQPQHDSQSQFRDEPRRKIIELWNASDLTVAGTLEGHEADVGGIAFSSDGKYLASASLDKTVIIWDVVTRKIAAKLAGHRGGVLCVAFSPDGRLLASGSTDTTILVWDLEKALKSADVGDAR